MWLGLWVSMAQAGGSLIVGSRGTCPDFATLNKSKSGDGNQLTREDFERPRSSRMQILRPKVSLSRDPQLIEAISAAQAAGATQQDLLGIARQQGSEGMVFAVSPSQTPGGRGTEVTIRDFQQVRNLKVGGQAYVWIETAAQNDVVVLPLGALVAREQQFYAFVVNEADGTVERRPVTRGIEGLSGVEILSGVEPGELVVVEGQNRLVEGTPVEIVNREAEQ